EAHGRPDVRNRLCRSPGQTQSFCQEGIIPGVAGIEGDSVSKLAYRLLIVASRSQYVSGNLARRRGWVFLRSCEKSLRPILGFIITEPDTFMPPMVIGRKVDQGERGVSTTVVRVELNRILKVGDGPGVVVGCGAPIVLPSAQERLVGGRRVRFLQG